MTHTFWQGAENVQPAASPYQHFFESLPGMYLILSPGLQIIAANNRFLQETQKQKENMFGRHFFDVFPQHQDMIKNEKINLIDSFRQVLTSGQAHTITILPYHQSLQEKPGSYPECYWHITTSAMCNEQEEVMYLIQHIEKVMGNVLPRHPLEQASQNLNTDASSTASKEDLLKSTGQKESQVEDELAQRAMDHYLTLINSMDEGFCILELIFDEDVKPIDYRYIEINHVFEQQTGMKNAFSKTIRELVPGIESFWFDIYGKVALTGESIRFEDHAVSMNRWFDVNAFRIGKPEDRQVAVLFSDITERKLAQEALHESEARFRLLVDTVPQIVWIIDTEGRSKFFNKQWTLFTGATYAPITAAEVAEKFVHPDDQEQTMKAFAEAVITGSTFTVEHRIRSAEGSYHWFLVKAEPYRDLQTGEIIYWFGVSINIHDRKMAEEALQESEERFRTMAEASGILIAHTDEAGNAVYFNQEWLKLTGRTMEELINYGWADFFHPDDRQGFVDAYMNAFQQRQGLKREFRLRSQSGEYRWQLAMVSPRLRPGGKFSGYISSCIDITELKQAGQKLQTVYQELAAVNAELLAANKELASTIHQLKHINADLDNFIYTASHDLKAPILNIEGLIKVLSRRFHKLYTQDEQIDHILDMMNTAVIRFRGTINDLTDIARIQKQMDQESESIDLQEIVHTTLLDLSQQVEESGARVESYLEQCPSVAFSRKNLKSVIYNLLSNAIKYRDLHRTPQIKITCRPEGDYLVLSVQDNGLGIDTRHENKIFGMFKRFHAHVEGTGVGLYIVKKMVENAGGKIAVESKLGEGSVFKVYFKQ
jgi:PAS domain S-box-containing protein